MVIKRKRGGLFKKSLPRQTPFLNKTYAGIVKKSSTIFSVNSNAGRSEQSFSLKVILKLPFFKNGKAIL